MFLAKLTGVFPRDVVPPAGEHEPTETRKFSDPDDAREWLFGAGLQNFQWPIARVELFSASGELLWSEAHFTHPSLQSQIEHWWRRAEPKRMHSDFRPMRLTRLVSPEHHPDASPDRQIITTLDRNDHLGNVTRTSDDTWTIELAGKRWTFQSEEACAFCVMGFEEGTGRPPRTMTLGQFLTMYAPEEHGESFRLGKELGESFVRNDDRARTKPSIVPGPAKSREMRDVEEMLNRTRTNAFFEVHAEINGKRGGLTFNLEGNKDEVSEVMRTADYVVNQMAGKATNTPEEFAKSIVRTLPSVASQNNDPDPQRLMHFASLYLIKISPQWDPDRVIRNASLWVKNDQVNVYIEYLADST